MLKEGQRLKLKDSMYVCQWERRRKNVGAKNSPRKGQDGFEKIWLSHVLICCPLAATGVNAREYTFLDLHWPWDVQVDGQTSVSIAMTTLERKSRSKFNQGGRASRAAVMKTVRDKKNRRCTAGLVATVNDTVTVGQPAIPRLCGVRWGKVKMLL